MKLSLNTKKLTNAFSYGEQLRPLRDWLVLLSVAALLLILSVGWNLWLFAKVTSGETIGSQSGKTAVEGLPDGAVERMFEGRAEERARYQNTYRFVDPSAPGR